MMRIPRPRPTIVSSRKWHAINVCFKIIPTNFIYNKCDVLQIVKYFLHEIICSIWGGVLWIRFKHSRQLIFSTNFFLNISLVEILRLTSTWYLMSISYFSPNSKIMQIERISFPNVTTSLQTFQDKLKKWKKYLTDYIVSKDANKCEKCECVLTERRKRKKRKIPGNVRLSLKDKVETGLFSSSYTLFPPHLF